MDDNFAPYAPTKAVVTVLDRFRERGLPDPLTIANLEQIGIQASNAPRTLQALRFLGLVDEGGNRLPAFNGLRQAKTEEYPGQLAEIIRSAYLPIFTIVDPATDSDIAISDAFRGYEPASTREKMVSLFMGLCRAAGIVTERPARRPGTAPRRVSTPTKRAASKGAASAPPVPDQLAQIQTPPPVFGSDLLFGAAMDYLRDLPADSINEVWDALGVIAKARVRSLNAARDMAEQAARRRAQEAADAKEDASPAE
jgi:hypothetical protein